MPVIVCVCVCVKLYPHIKGDICHATVCSMFYFVLMPVPDQEAEEEAEGSVSEQAATKQAPKKRPPKKTVEQNLSNINLSESEMKCEVKDIDVSSHQSLHS